MMIKISNVKIDGKNNPVEIYVSDIEKVREKYQKQYHTSNILFVSEELDNYGEALAMLHSMVAIVDKYTLALLDNGLYGLTADIDQYHFEETGSMHDLAAKMGAWLVDLPENVFVLRSKNI